LLAGSSEFWICKWLLAGSSEFWSGCKKLLGGGDGDGDDEPLLMDYKGLQFYR
tara:strand:+ start:76 stop:234 length:159 start_codon:yes stop_codon:yes gene_type:complete